MSAEAGVLSHGMAMSRVGLAALAGHHASMSVSRFTGAADGVSLIAEGFGEPAATPVVLLHGGGQTRHSWRTTATGLQAAGWSELAAAAGARHMVVGDDNGVFHEVVGDVLDRRVRPSQELLRQLA